MTGHLLRPCVRRTLTIGPDRPKRRKTVELGNFGVTLVLEVIKAVVLVTICGLGLWVALSVALGDR